jgi:hypothetical protein
VIGGKWQEGKADWKNKLLYMKLPPPIRSFSDLWYGHFMHYCYMAYADAIRTAFSCSATALNAILRSFLTQKRVIK